MSGPFLGIPSLAEAPPSPPLEANYRHLPLLEMIQALRAFDARSAEMAEMTDLREKWIREHSKGIWEISERTGSVLPFSTSTLGVIPLLVQE